MVDPTTDFSGYMNELADVEAATQRTQELLEQHEIWRQTTWAGFFVRQLQSMMRKLEPVIDQVVEPFSDTDTFAGALTMNLIRLVAIITMMLAFSVVAKIIQNVVGTELIVQEEIVILHEHASEDEAAKARAKNSRNKKEKRQ